MLNIAHKSNIGHAKISPILIFFTLHLKCCCHKNNKIRKAFTSAFMFVRKSCAVRCPISWWICGTSRNDHFGYCTFWKVWQLYKCIFSYSCVKKTKFRKKSGFNRNVMFLITSYYNQYWFLINQKSDVFYDFNFDWNTIWVLQISSIKCHFIFTGTCLALFTVNHVYWLKWIVSFNHQ